MRYWSRSTSNPLARVRQVVRESSPLVSAFADQIPFQAPPDPSEAGETSPTKDSILDRLEQIISTPEIVPTDETPGGIGSLGDIARRLAAAEVTVDDLDRTRIDDHGNLTGLGDDDHTQYHNNTRGDVRYYTKSELMTTGILDARYYTEDEHIYSSSGAGDAHKPIELDAGGHVDATMINDGDIDHDALINTHDLEGTSILSTGPVTDGHVLTADGAGAVAWEAAAGGGVSSMDDLSDADTTTDAPALSEVLKWDGSNWVPAEYDYEFAFSIASFSDGISDTSQLIGSGTWKAIGAITFTATYNNPPGGMTAEVAMSGANNSWGGNLSMTPVEGPEDSTEIVEYPTTTGGTVVFTLHQSVDGTTDTESVSFNNTMRYGNSALTQGNQTEGSLEALTEVGGPNESRSQTISNIPTTANYLVFGYADRLSDVQQVRRNHDGLGYVTASFNSVRTTVAPSVQGGVASVDNSAGYSETFACITATDTGLGDGSDDFQLLTSGTAQNYLYWGELNKDAGGDGGSQYTESDVENNYATQPGKVASNSISSRSMTVNALVTEYTYIAYPARLGALSSIVIGGLESIGDFWIDAGSGTELAITNDGGFQEDYYVYVSKNPGFTDPTTMTVSL